MQHCKLFGGLLPLPLSLRVLLVSLIVIVTKKIPKITKQLHRLQPPPQSLPHFAQHYHKSFVSQDFIFVEASSGCITRLLEKLQRDGTPPQTEPQTDAHRDLKTESAYGPIH